MRLGLIHGGCSNSFIFRQQIKHLLPLLPKDVELVDLEGGLLSEAVRFDDRGRKNMALLYKVFGSDQVLREHAVTCYDEVGAFFYERLDEGTAHLEAQLRALPSPVDALLGFSQGANFSTILSARAWHQVEGASPPFRALILLENDPPAWPAQMPELFASPLAVPALLVGGQLDSPKTQAVGRLYANAEFAYHNDGHRPLPKDPTACKALVERIRDFLRAHAATVQPQGSRTEDDGTAIEQ